MSDWVVQQGQSATETSAGAGGQGLPAVVQLPPELEQAPSREHWLRVGGARRRLGVATPLFSVRTRTSTGIGEYPDIARMVDWCVEIGASILQLLPLNDIGPGGSPYSALSAMALDPTYISLAALAERVGDPGWTRRVAELAATLEAEPRVQYERVRFHKDELLRQAFARLRGALEQEEGFVRFCAANVSWLDGYVTFRVLKEASGWRSWEEWSEGRSPVACQTEAERDWADELAYRRFQQYLAAQQLEAARRYAESRGVLLKGDIPILVSRDSADVWQHPHLFHLDATAGAPPDMYAADGQNWGFPTYDWDALAAQDYAWWRTRLRAMEPLFHLYRIDHVIGFFRIWTIALGERNGLNGRFVPGEEWRWEEHGRRLLGMMLQSCSLLPLAEDLGTVPDQARAALWQMAIPGLKVARWEKRWHGDRSFIHPSQYPWLSVATSSTHDSETLAGWWQDFPEERWQLHRELGLGEWGVPETLTPALAERLLGDLARSSSVFAILPLWDLLELAPAGYLFPQADENRVNVPGRVHPRDWTWRIRRPLEDLLEERSYAARLRAVLDRG